jgi:ATP-dependent DNA helicase DinG
MLKPHKTDIADIAVVFAHTGTKEYKNNRVYAIAATILDINGKSKTFESFVHYPYLTARDRYYSNVSKETLSNSSEASCIFPQINHFLKDTDIVLTLPYQDNYSEIQKICPDKRFIDLGFAVEFFLPHIDSFSPKRIWEYLHKQERKRIYFAASEVVALSIDIIEDICRNELNDAKLPRAAAIRHYLEKSNTLFGTLFLHFVKDYEKYFGELFNPCHTPDTPDWQIFLESVSAKRQKINKADPTEKIRIDKLETVYRGLSESEKGFTFRSSQVDYARHVAQAINDKAVLTIEAGTGTGKTQGYLIPVMEYLSRNPDERIAVSTYTKSLQDQIFQQEIAFIKNANKMYRDISVSLLKGKSNYICAAKLGHVYDETWEGQKLLTWLYFVNLTYHFRDADGEQTGQRISHYLNEGSFFYHFQREVSARNGCDSNHTRCPAQIVSTEALAARLIVTNHHKLMLLNHDPILNGLFKTYIIDEANHFGTGGGQCPWEGI